MIGIKGIATYIPTTGIDNIEQAKKFGENLDFIEKKIGAKFLPRKLAEQDTSDLATLALHNLLEANPQLTKEKIEALVVVTQNGDKEGLPHTSALVQQKADLPISIAAFDVSLGCSGYVYGLHILKGFMESAGLKNAVLITADPYSKILNSEDKNTSLLFGDAATATWLGKDPLWEVGLASFGTDGSGAEALHVEQKTLHMNGRQVFDFAAKNVAKNIKALLDSACITEEEIDAFYLHQGSYAILDVISRRFKGNKDKFIKDIENTGNSVSSSIPILLANHLFSSEQKKVVLSGFGVGLSWASIILAKR